MARKLSDIANTDPIDGEYLYGRIRDRVGAINGTQVDEELYGDIHQLMARMLDKAGITPNNLPDNDYDEFQLFEAYKIAMYEDWQVPSYSGGFTDDASSPVRFRRKGKTIRIKGIVFDSTPNSLSVSTPVFTLPTGYRPAETQLFATLDDGVTKGLANISVTSAGVVSIRGDLRTVTSDSVWMNLSFDVDA